MDSKAFPSVWKDEGKQEGHYQLKCRVVDVDAFICLLTYGFVLYLHTEYRERYLNMLCNHFIRASRANR